MQAAFMSPTFAPADPSRPVMEGVVFFIGLARARLIKSGEFGRLVSCCIPNTFFVMFVTIH